MRSGAGAAVAAGADWLIDGEESVFLTHHYHIDDVLEKGPVCTIYRATNRMTSKAFIVKTIDMKKYKACGFSTDDIDREIAICATLRHEYFMQLQDAITGSNAVHLVFEYVEGSDICFEVVKRAAAGFVYSEAVASHYIRQLVEALHFMHSQRIIHRDIRPHNIVLATVDNNTPLKVRGFGVALRLDEGETTLKAPRVGIPQFMSPEVVGSLPFGTASDMWSVGALMYLLLSGRLPFNGPLSHVYECISEGKYSLQGPPWNYISDEAKDLLTRLLTVDAERRFSAEETLRHCWISDKTVPKRQHLNGTVENIRGFNLRRKLKSKVIAAVNNLRWNRFPVHSFLSADSMPGGDACDSECNPRYENSDAVLITPDDAAGVEKILGSLDLISVLVDPVEPDGMLKQALMDQNFESALSLYDRIATSRVKPIALNVNADQHLSESRAVIDSLIAPSAEAIELGKLLDNVHLQAILQANDIVIEEVFTTTFAPESNSSDYILRPEASNSAMPNSAPGAQRQSGQLSPVPLSLHHAAVVPPGVAHAPRGVPASNSSRSTPTTFTNDSNVPQVLPHAKTNGSATKPLSVDVGPSTSTPAPIQFEPITTLPRPQNLKNQEPTPLFADDDDDLMTNVVSRIRIIQFTKDTEEPMGITLKITEDGRCLVARIMHGGMIHRQATLHVGDEIREINGLSVANQSVEALQRMLRDARGHVTFKIVPSYRSAPPACEIYVRAQFDYDPIQDDLIPCAQAGVPFKTGDIIQVISKDDHNWWQARYVCPFPALGTSGGHHPNSNSNPAPSATSSSASSQASTAVLAAGPSSPSSSTPIVAGLIPSPELQEWRTACMAMERAKDGSHCLWFNKKKKYYTTKYLRKHSELFDQMDLVTYEEVVRLTSFRRKTLVLLGAHGVGRRHIKNTLIHRHPQRFAYPIPHTTRPPRKDEVDGKHYYFVSNDQMLSDIQNSEYLEYGTHEECMYGTKLETIRAIHRQGKMAILDVEPQALKVLRTAEYAPFVVFIAAPDLQGLQDPDGSLERLGKESEVLRQAFGHLFDYVICNNDIDETIRQLEVIVEKLSAIPQWVPVSWVY
uniref:Peripheral plasma membrane protein CASK n=1 Tax=Panagrellus redivivus TaxID=6233 RepID=A0A7E4VVL5_PANRE